MPYSLSDLKGFGSGIEYLKNLLEEGIPYSNALEQVNELGLSLIPEVSEIVKTHVLEHVIPFNLSLEELSHNVLPSVRDIPTSLTKLLRNFSYRVKLTGQSQFGGQLEDRYISISTNSLLTKEQALSSALSIAEDNTKSGGINGAEGTVESISQNAAGLTNIDAILPPPGPQYVIGPDEPRKALLSNRSYLQTIASGPVTPISFSLTGEIKSDSTVGDLGAFIKQFGQ